MNSLFNKLHVVLLIVQDRWEISKSNNDGWIMKMWLLNESQDKKEQDEATDE